MTNIFAILAFILGASIGSFLSVVIYRLKHNVKGIVSSHSICPSCKNKIRWHHLIPVFSWILLRGKCAYCNKKISAHYFIIELATGLLFLSVFLHFNFLTKAPSLVDPTLMTYGINWSTFSLFIYFLIIISLLMAIFFYDLLYKEIPDHFSVPAILIAIIGGIVFGTTSVVSMTIGGIGIFTFFLLQFAISRGTWVGGGDLRLGLFTGVFLGWELGLLAIILSYIIGAIFSIFLIVKGKASRKTAIAFGPFMVMGILISFFYGEEIINWYLHGVII